MGELAAERPELTALTLPRRGLEELLRGWNSDGQLFDALSAVTAVEMDVRWSADAIERRAARVLLEKMESVLLLLPDDPGTWRENLPVTTTSAREVSDRPLRPTDWATTARRYGWPPKAFVGHPRSRVKDESALQTLTWTARNLERMVRDVRGVAPLLVGRIERPILTMIDVVRSDLPDVEALRPDRLDLRSLASSGRPWSTLAMVAASLLQAQTDLEFLAFELIEPNPELAWRLFHLSVLGEVLAAVRSLGGRVRWNTPLTAGESSGPQFQLRIGQNIWDLWFEASAAARYYQVASPYKAATTGVSSIQRAIGADILLCLPGRHALMLECKWSALGSYVGRNGYHQASSYLIEARCGLADNARSYVIGPEEVVRSQSETELNWPGGVAAVGVGSIEHVAGLVRSLVGESR
ncbi:hypothetical protein ACSNN9_15960 [Micromonospora sp. URMC 107]|uniref:hypothetical protein n=1 Tax=Micromonospora sp. URMC 107 TaxID=3423418 RepID=UPI003F1D157E